MGQHLTKGSLKTSKKLWSRLGRNLYSYSILTQHTNVGCMGVFAFGARLFAYTRDCPKRFVESALPYRMEFRETLLESQIIAQSFSILYDCSDRMTWQ